MPDITKIPIAELLADREASANDIIVCLEGRKFGVECTRDGTKVEYRLETKRKIVRRIEEELKRHGGGKSVVTSHVFPPIPLRCHDWSAVRDGYDTGDPMGMGETESAAIADLIAQEERNV